MRRQQLLTRWSVGPIEAGMGRRRRGAAHVHFPGAGLAQVVNQLFRGTTSKKLIHHLRQAGAREVHVRSSAPPTTHSCFYGTDTPTRKELLASHQSIEDIRKFIGADTLGYLSLKGLMTVARNEEGDDGFCHACFSGEYPTAIV